MEYPRTVVLKNEKMLKLQLDFAKEIEEGRAVSKQIEDVELEMGKIDIRLQVEEAKVDVKDLREKGNEIIKQMDGVAKDFAEKIKGIEKEIFERMKANTSPELRTQHEELDKQKKELETERNKKALKAQKFRDRIAPTAQRLIKSHLTNKYEDLGGLDVINGQIIAKIISYLDEWDKAFEKRLAKNNK